MLVITVSELMNCIDHCFTLAHDHCFTLAHVYFVYLIKTNLTLLTGTKWWSGRTRSPMMI